NGRTVGDHLLLFFAIWVQWVRVAEVVRGDLRSDRGRRLPVAQGTAANPERQADPGRSVGPAQHLHGGGTERYLQGLHRRVRPHCGDRSGAGAGQPPGRRVIFTEINQEVACRATVLAGRIPYLRGSEGLNGSLELESQRMVHRNVATEFHVGITGTGLTS